MPGLSSRGAGVLYNLSCSRNPCPEPLCSAPESCSVPRALGLLVTIPALAGARLL